MRPVALFYSLLAGTVLFALLYGVARWATLRDPQMLQILLRSAGVRRRYDAARPRTSHVPVATSRRRAPWFA